MNHILQSYLLLFQLFQGWQTEIWQLQSMHFTEQGTEPTVLCDVVFCVSSLIIFFPRLEEEEIVMILHYSQSLMLVSAPRKASGYLS